MKSVQIHSSERFCTASRLLAVPIAIALCVCSTTSTYGGSALPGSFSQRDADRVVILRGQVIKTGEDFAGLPQEAFTALHNARSFESVASYDLPSRITVTMGNGNEVVQQAEVSPDFLSVIGVPPFLGREFRSDDAESSQPVAILTYNLWQRGFASDKSIVGRTITCGDGNQTITRMIIGVLSTGFWYPKTPIPTLPEPDILVPALIHWDQPLRPNEVLFLLGRLKEGVDIDKAQAETGSLSEGLFGSTSKDKGLRIVVRRLGPNSK